MTSGEFQLSCDDLTRRQLLRNSTTLNGIDYLEVVPPEVTGDLPLLVVFLYHGLPQGPAQSPLGPKNVRITGGTRIQNIGIEWVRRFAELRSSNSNLQSLISADLTIPDETKVIVIRPTTDGDFSTYTLELIDASNPGRPPPGFDILLSETPFGFKVECTQNFDCAPARVRPQDTLQEPVIDYLTKDFNSFNTLMLNRLSLINPGWQEHHPADVGVALVELLAYVGDQLSYYQDAVATEAYLGTARRRVSMRRHARLLDYFMHEGCNARAWVTMEIEPAVDGLLVPAGTGLLTGGEGDPTVVSGGLDQALEGAMVFETMTDVTLHSAQNQIQFYTWQEDDCCLPPGGTAVTLRNDDYALDLPICSIADPSALLESAGQTELIAALAGATTTTSGICDSGQDVLTVSATTGLAPGTVIVINPGGANQESAVIASVDEGSVSLGSSLTKEHQTNEPVSAISLATYLLGSYGASWMEGARCTIISGPAGAMTTGTTSAGTSSTVLLDTGGAWTTDQLAGYYLTYTSGPASGQSLLIASNTRATITTAASFSAAPTPAGGDSFSLVTTTIALSDGVHSVSTEFGGGAGSAIVTVDGTQVDELVVTSNGGGLRFSSHSLQIGDVLIFEEVRSPTTGRQADADPSHRCAVRLTGVTAMVDPLDASSTPLLNVSWDPADGPSFPLCLEMVQDPDYDNISEPVSVARGNVVLADNGQTQSIGRLPLQSVFPGTTTPGSREGMLCDADASWVVNQWVGYYLEYATGPATGQSLLIASNTKTTITTTVAFSTAPTPAGGDSFNITSSGYTDAHGNFYTWYTDSLGNTPRQPGGGGDDGADDEGVVGGRFRPGLSYQPVTYAAPFDPSKPASSAFGYDVRTALPSITVLGQTEVWLPQRDLLSSDEFQYQFVTEVDNDGTAYIRFGDGTLGSAPVPSTKQDPNPFYAIYRVGNGSEGNVGREAISRIVNASVYGACVQTDAPFDGTGILNVRNPMEAEGGVDPEDMEDVRQFAPYAFGSLQRAVTSPDYATILRSYPGIQQGYAQLRWTGSWWTYYISVDRKAGFGVDAPFQSMVETRLDSYRMACYDLEITDPVYVPLYIAMDVCAAQGYNPSNVLTGLLEAFGTTVLPDGTKGFFYPDNFTFGQTVFLSTIYETATSVAGISSVVVTAFQRYPKAGDGGTPPGEITMGPSEVARLDNDPNFPENGTIVITVNGGGKATGVGSLP